MNISDRSARLKILGKPAVLFLCTCLLSLLCLLWGTGCSNDTRRLALWNAGVQDGGFEFSFCQKELDEAEEESLAEKIKEQDFRTGFFFGSSESYNFTDLINYIDIDKESEISTFNANGEEKKSETKLEDFLELDGGSISSAAASLFSEVGIGAGTLVWTFTDAEGRYHSENCMNAKNNSSSENGRALQDDAISQSSLECSQSALVLCLAK